MLATNNMAVGGIQGLEKILKRVKELATDSRHVERPMKASGTYMLGSIEKNFKAGGRPNRWTGLSAATIARRRNKKKSSIKILIDTARLKNSHQFRLVSEGVQIGTNVIYAPRQHFGYEGGSGRGHAKTPARPFLMFQEEDIREIGEIFTRHIAR